MFSRDNLYSLSVLALLLLVLASASCRQKEQVLQYDIALQDGWHIRSSAEVKESGADLSGPGLDLAGWSPASIPTTVLAALRKNGEYPDPFFGKNLEDIPVERFAHSWWYRREFDLPEKNKLSFVRLGFEGINYRANIWLNGKQIASQEDVYGAFRVFELDITGVVRPEKNVLAVEVFPPRPGDFTVGFVDWNPEPPDQNMGLWRPVALHLSGPVYIEVPFVMSKVNLETLAEASLTVTAEVVNHSDKPISGTLQGELENLIFKQSVQLGPRERKTVELSPPQFPELNLKDPRLWWPTNLGEQNLYTLKLNFRMKNLTSDAKTVSFGIREVADYVNEEGHRGFKVNGQKVLIRGGGWVDDLFLAEDQRNLEAKVKYTKHMNLNTIRLEGFWGSGHELYNLCDKYGILLMAGWSCQWEWENYLGKPDDDFGGVTTPEDMELVARSLQDQVIMWRNHPSVFVWMLGSDKLPRPELERKYIQMMKTCDPSRPYVMSAKGLQSEVTGPTRVKMNGPYDYVPPIYWFEDTANGGAFGFNTETGPGPQPPPLESLKKMLPEKNLWPIDDVWNYHCARHEFNTLDRYLEALNRRYGPAHDLQDFVRKAQAANYEAMRAMFEAFAAHRPTATGVIQWMLNAAWPKLYWQLYDYYLMPNGAFYGAMKASRPVHILYHPKNDAVYVVNDLRTSQSGLKAQIRILDLMSQEIFKDSKDIDIPANSSSLVMLIPEMKGLTAAYFMDLKLVDDGGKVVSDNFYWLSTKKDVMNYPATEWFVTPIKEFADFTALNRLPEVSLKVLSGFEQTGAERKVRVTLENPTDTIAFFIELGVAGRQSGNSVLPIYWEDNYISLLPGESKTVSGRFAVEDLRGDEPVLRVSGWNIKQD